MRTRLLIAIVFGMVTCVVSGAPVPAANLLAQIAEAGVIVMGSVQRVDTAGRGEIDTPAGVVAGTLMVADMRVDQVLKGEAPSSVRIAFLIPDVPNGYQGLLPNTYRVVFLRNRNGEYQLSSPYHPSTTAVAGASVTGATPADRVIAAVGRVASSESVPRQWRLEALFALWGISHQAAREAVSQTLAAADLEVRLTGAAVMLSADVLEGLPTAEAVLSEPPAGLDAHLLHNLRVAISQGVRQPAAVTPLSRLLQISEPETRRAATAALAEIGDPSVVNPLAIALDDSDFEVRLNAVRGLARVSSQPQLRPSVDAFRSDERRFVAPLKEWVRSRQR